MSRLFCSPLLQHSAGATVCRSERKADAPPVDPGAKFNVGDVWRTVDGKLVRIVRTGEVLRCMFGQGPVLELGPADLV